MMVYVLMRLLLVLVLVLAADVCCAQSNEIRCETDGVALTLRLPDDLRVEPSDGACVYVSSHNPHPVALFDARLVLDVRASSAPISRSERRWAAQSLANGEVQESGAITVLGRRTHWYLVEGETSSGADEARWQLIAMRTRVGRKWLTVRGYFAPRDARERERVMQILASLRLA